MASCGSDRVILAGHSYAGIVITGAASHLGDRVAAIVYIDAYVATQGDSCWSLTTDHFRERMMIASRGDGIWMDVFGANDERAKPHPVATMIQGLALGPHVPTARRGPRARDEMAALAISGALRPRAR